MMKQQMRSIVTVFTAFMVLWAPVALRAWSMDGHRYLTRRAIENMPSELRAFLTPHALDLRV